MEQSKWDAFFQKRYIAFLLQDPAFANRVRPDLTAELFTDEFAQKTARISLAFYDKHGAPPGDLIFTELDNIASKVNTLNGQLIPLKTYIRDALGVPLQNREFILSEHDKFMGHQRLLKMFPKFAEAMKAGDHDGAQALLTEVVTFKPSSQEKPGKRFDPDPTARIERRSLEDTERFWLLIPELDSRVDGLRRGELGLLQSQRSSAGKTAGLIHFAKSFVLQSKKVLIITLEDGKEAYEDKLDMAVSGVSTRELRDHVTIASAMRRWFRHGGDIHIAEFSPGTTVRELRAYKRFLESTENFYADAVIVDYADLLGPDNPLVADSLFSAGLDVYTNMSRWAKDEHICLWTACQSGRSADEQTHADMSDVSLSIAKMWVAWLVISINRTAEEQAEGITQLYVVKNKNGPSRYSVAIRSDFDRYHFYTYGRDDAA